jgi:fumarate reductase subunit C
MAGVQSRTELRSQWREQRLSASWWLEKKSYTLFMVREASCLFVGWFAVYLMMLVRAVSQGEASYGAFLAWSAGPLVVLLNFVSLGFILYHAATFFSAAPQALVVRLGGNRLPGSAITGAHWAGLVALSAFVAWILLGA